jgi:NAD(P)-dependent dehydrogenase (short-subunit alcohol dehydrogenase family)
VTLKLDVTDGVAVKALAQLCAKTGLHGVVNSAGVAVPPGRKIPIVQSIVEADVDVSVLPVLQINTVGTMRVNNAVFDLIFKSAGVFVNIASVSGRLATPGMGAYSVSKFGVVAYSNCMRRELAPCESHCGCTTQTTAVVDNIRVVCIEPGFAKTAILDGVKVAPDVTKTRLFERSFANAKDRDDLYESIGGDAMQSADDVAAHILTALFSSQVSKRERLWAWSAEVTRVVVVGTASFACGSPVEIRFLSRVVGSTGRVLMRRPELTFHLDSIIGLMWWLRTCNDKQWQRQRLRRPVRRDRFQFARAALLCDEIQIK